MPLKKYENKTLAILAYEKSFTISCLAKKLHINRSTLYYYKDKKVSELPKIIKNKLLSSLFSERKPRGNEKRKTAKHLYEYSLDELTTEIKKRGWLLELKYKK